MNDDYSMHPGLKRYSAEHIRKTTWGDVTDLEGGRWETVWHLSFVEPHPVATIEIDSDDEIGFRGTLHILENSAGELRVVTDDEPMLPEYYSPTYVCFRIVHDDIAEIGTIQGLPRDWYAPFRDRTTS
ncbi:hypothetical protein [Nocardia sp. NPDC049526]|uniref:hypothetical protein n=1 Tax=Nocardia sp. NPDC049526 TaxID=3364316 RepID=UPI0037B59755